MAYFTNTSISEIAEKAGLSTATVSRVINNTGNVRQSTKNRVFEAINELEPSSASQFIQRSANRMIVASAVHFGSPCANSVLTGISSAAAARNYALSVYINPNPFSLKEYDFIETRACDGLLVVHDLPDYEIVKQLQARKPVVICHKEEGIPSDSPPYVDIDNRAAAFEAVSYLLSTGRKRIALVNSSPSKYFARQREAGYKDALKKAGIPLTNESILHLPDLNYDSALGSIAGLLDSPARPDAFFCISDVFASAAARVAQEKGFSVPEDISVIGFDDTDFAKISHPTLTTVHQPSYQIGWQSCNLLIDMIENPTANYSHIDLTTDLIVREST